ncbi:ATP-dependent zinc metalloprotease FtsH [Acholeplasma laidlawii]|uniref:ATP-dependent zinc metalloprotease FtsH n=2 Tax=Acholeplasma laidlawii TaxID=2148 RepID=FTSH_ACHLI|nr:ATP-dependent zinc metalloprotease FtsH [Acholeplasma laidlawii]A9NE17.1 RecName: Full=ATP-dependent zinc metalloprotease FtsH [Acholeplasma laidlawii PG-8A]ABX81977.1 mebrane-bound ATP-dependent metalloprotease [Acholeplasma laidlawii PG-8A]NWH10958.1 ATP-dependent zinc metalloprotease FtsH [Acholeplasma laidlawii]NWH12344.1 ATP-dependent zinc metalloprotease FtsH [Acholeplasma laidlawii]NWH13730.1 ATP-dependent zinc metalloprotease FtsH [Acholeplasma laidlawii]NWH14948.1 ATP-dependent zi
MNKQQKPKRSPLRPDYLVIVIIILLAIGMYFFFTEMMAPKVKQFDEFEFIAAIESGQIATVRSEYVGGDNFNLWEVTGTFTTGNAPEGVGSYVIILYGDRLNNIQDIIITYNELNPSTPITVSFVPHVSVDFWNIISTLLLIAAPIVLVVIMFRSMSSQSNKAQDFTKNRAKLSQGRKVKFSDIAGADEEKAEMAELIDFLKNPKKYADMGARVPKGVLLVGQPGTGKTLLAKAVAGEAQVPFFSISGSDFVELYVGVGASRVRDLFKVAKQSAPCIIFIDEIDAVGRQRGAGMGGGNDEREQTLNQLLVEMDGFSANLGIIIMAATNRPDVLDPALLRPGRFDRQITMQVPDQKSREEILKVHARSKKLDPTIKFSEVAMRIPGFTGADIENLLNEAALLAARESRTVISMQDIDEAADRVTMGPAKKSRKYSPNEKKMVAYHEAGHAVIGLKVNLASTVQKVTIVPRGRAGGYALYTPVEEKFNYAKSELLAMITSALGGRVAEEIMFDDVTTGAYDDFKRATKLARSMVTEYGMSDLGPIQYESDSGNVFLGRDYLKDKNFSDAVALEIDREVRAIITECYEHARKVINENKNLLDNIAKYLIAVETLTKTDIDEIAATGQLQWWDNREVEEDSKKSE